MAISSLMKGQLYFIGKIMALSADLCGGFLHSIILTHILAFG